MKKTLYHLKSDRIHGRVRMAICSDLHDRDGGQALALLADAGVDLICIPGDLTQRIDLEDGEKDRYHGDIGHANARAFLRGCSEIAPTFLSLGNHEMGSGHGENAIVGRRDDRIAAAFALHCGATLLRRVARVGQVALGGVHSGYYEADGVPRLDQIDALEREAGLRVVLCHHPEYYPRYLRERGVDLVLSGHAHGGQIRLFGRGLYAPGQGLFPKYTAGVHENRLVISRGMANTVPIPRLFNPREIVILEIEGS